MLPSSQSCNEKDHLPYPHRIQKRDSSPEPHARPRRQQSRCLDEAPVVPSLPFGAHFFKSPEKKSKNRPRTMGTGPDESLLHIPHPLLMIRIETSFFLYAFS